VTLARAVDLRYEGQSFELAIPLPPDWGGPAGVAALAEGFARAHERAYGHAAPGDPIQVVNVRVTARLVRSDAARPVRRRDERPTGPAGCRRAHFGPGRGTLPTPVLARGALDRRARPGPLLVDEYDATTLVPPGAAAALDDHGNIVITTGGSP
jgi:N-methylhydantoinase A